MIISATFLKPRERRIREEGREQGRAEERAKTAEVTQTLEQERAAWQAWYYLNEVAKAKGEEPPPPPFFSSGDNGQSNGQTG